MKRCNQVTLILSTLCLSWLAMMIVHETGHVVAAWICGERVEKVVLHPIRISRTDVSHDHHPLIVVWSGPVAGSCLPLLALGLARRIGFRAWYVVQFFAGFCLIANGAYLGVGGFEGIGDAGDLVRFGARPWHLIAFGIVGIPSGFVLWHGLGRHFGLRSADGEVDRVVTIRTFGVLLIIVVIELLVDRG